MKELLLRIEERHYAVLLRFLKTLGYVNVVEKKRDAGPRSYDFSDLAGKLQWQGDALLEQKKLRDEW